MKISSLVLVFALFLNTLSAQDTSVRITGKVVENTSNQPLEYATIKLLKGSTEELITGTTTSVDGSFQLESETQDFSLEVGFIGFVRKKITEFNVVNGKVDLGVITLSENTETLEEIIVQGEKSRTVFKLDKRVFNVGQDLSSTGASALEVLNNVPSVTVNIEGEIRLRGSAGVQILVDGKPSVLASEQGNVLGTLTADMIESIEVITNPSAKYDAEGTTGIINIVLRKEEKKGLNGSVTVNTGTPNNHSLGLSVNRRTEKFNIFSQLGMGYRTFPEQYETINRDLINNTSVYGSGESEKNERFFNLILGTDYHINSQNVLSLTGHFAYEFETEFSDTEFSKTDSSNLLLSQWIRSEETDATNPKWQYELQYKRDFSDHNDHTLLFSALGSYFGKDQSSEFDITRIMGEEPLADLQRTSNDFREAEYTFKLDYVQPFSEKITWEAGAQYVITDVSNDYSVGEWINNEWKSNPDLTNVFEYNQKVLGLYSTGAYEGRKFGLKVGLRVEDTDISTLLVNTDQSTLQEFANIFPTIHSSYKILDHLSLQAGYSRRISRPDLWDLNPFFNIRNNYSIRTGNPLLQPEFTDSYEITGIFDQGNLSLSAAVYHHFTTDIVENVSIFEENVSIVKPYNIGTNRATGFELNSKLDLTDWWSLNSDFNFNYYRRKGNFESATFDFDADQWTARLTNKFELPAQVDLELTGHYRSDFQTYQQEISGYMFADLGVRKKIMNGKTVLNLSIRDVFASGKFESENMQSDFYLYNYRLRGRFITAGISYGFGKGEAMEFSGQKRF